MIEVVHYRNTEKLQRQVWSFYVHGERIVLCGYREEERPTPRHRTWRGIVWWSAYATRSNILTLDQVPFPDDVAAEAKQQQVDKLQVVKGHDRFGS